MNRFATIADKLTFAMVAATVYKTMDDLFQAYKSPVAYFDSNDLVGVLSEDRQIHWYRYTHEKGGYVQSGSTSGPGTATKRRTNIGTEKTLDGMSKRQAAKKVNTILSAASKGLFRDQSWEAVNKVWKELDRAGIDYNITHTEYMNDPNTRMPNAKMWKFEVPFQNEKFRPAILFGVLTAHGAGSVEDPLDRYDITAYVS